VAPLLVYCLLSLTAIFFQEVHPLWLVRVRVRVRARVS